MITQKFTGLFKAGLQNLNQVEIFTELAAESKQAIKAATTVRQKALAEDMYQTCLAKRNLAIAAFHNTLKEILQTTTPTPEVQVVSMPPGAEQPENAVQLAEHYYATKP